MPVGATTTTLRSVSAMNRRISVDLPVPAFPVRKRCLPSASSASAWRNSSVRTISRAAGGAGSELTVTPRGEHVLDPVSYLIPRRLTVDPRHQKLVIVGIDVADRCRNSKFYGNRIQGPAGRASSHTAAAARCRVTRDRFGASGWAAGESLPDLGCKFLLEADVLVRPSNLVALPTTGPHVSVGQALLLGTHDRFRFSHNALAFIAFA